MRAVELLFGLRLRVGRAPYVRWGFALALVKFAIDTAVVRAFTHKVWSPVGYVVPSLVLRNDAVGSAPNVMLFLLPLLAMPFLWIGLSMSVRRAADAGLSPWVGTLFLVPLVNYVVITALCVMPSRPGASWDLSNTAAFSAAQAPADIVRLPPAPRAALVGLLTSIAIGFAMLLFCVYGLGTYGLALFFATPFAMGASSAAIYNRDRPRTVASTIGVALAGVVLTGSAVLLFALEGVFCIAMAAPIAAAIATLGALVGRAVVNTGRRGGFVAPAMILVAPGVALGESRLATPIVREVTTAIDINAPPEKVWPNVVGFTDLDEPPSWFFRLGIAYPKRARMLGEGVGAVRRCEFSTGPFVEPITTWLPPQRLAFDVTSQPPSMTEWSPYGAIHAPHLEGYMTSKGGEFDLERISDGRTRLEGTTHYTLSIYPEVYWRPFAEALLHAIHGRVLRHIKKLSEA